MKVLVFTEDWCPDVGVGGMRADGASLLVARRPDPDMMIDVTPPSLRTPEAGLATEIAALPLPSVVERDP